MPPPGTPAPLPVAVLEAEAEAADPLKGMQQARGYARCGRFRLRCVCSSNGHRYGEFEADMATAQRFVAAIETAMRHVASHPTTGSLRYAAFGVRAELRFRPVHGFPRLIFHRVHDGKVDVSRVLHAQRDIPPWLHDRE